MEYQIEIHASAEKDLRRLDSTTFDRIARAIDMLVPDPRPRGARKIRGGIDLYRIRVGAYRIVYQVKEAALVVLVVRVGHRSKVYKGKG